MRGRVRQPLTPVGAQGGQRGGQRHQPRHLVLCVPSKNNQILQTDSASWAFKTADPSLLQVTQYECTFLQMCSFHVLAFLNACTVISLDKAAPTTMSRAPSPPLSPRQIPPAEPPAALVQLAAPPALGARGRQLSGSRSLLPPPELEDSDIAVYTCLRIYMFDDWCIHGCTCVCMRAWYLTVAQCKSAQDMTLVPSQSIASILQQTSLSGSTLLESTVQPETFPAKTELQSAARQNSSASVDSLQKHVSSLEVSKRSFLLYSFVSCAGVGR